MYHRRHNWKRIKERIAERKKWLGLYRQAVEVLLTTGNESWSIGNQTFKRLDMDKLNKRIAELEAEIDRMERGGGLRVQLAEPH